MEPQQHRNKLWMLMNALWQRTEFFRVSLFYSYIFFLSCYYYFIIKFLPCHGKGTDLIALESVIAALFQQPRKTTGKWLFCTLNTRGKKKKKRLSRKKKKTAKVLDCFWWSELQGNTSSWVVGRLGRVFHKNRKRWFPKPWQWTRGQARWCYPLPWMHCRV